MSSCLIQNKELSDILLSDKEANIDSLIHYICTKQGVNDECIDGVRDKISRYFLPAFNRKLKASFFNRESFETKNSDWLQSYFTSSLERVKCGRPLQEHFNEASPATKQRKIECLRNSYSSLEIELAFLRNLRDAGKKNLAKTIAEMLQNDDDFDTETENDIIPMDENAALAFIEDLKLSKYQYERMRSEMRQRNANVFVSYKLLAAAKQECYPEESAFDISESAAKVNLQKLLDHTAKRIVSTIDNGPPQNESSSIDDDCTEMFVTLHVKYGCDGSSDQSQYKQSFSTEGTSDESIFMTSMVPICMESETSTIWKNPHPSSTKFCRLISFEYAKETPNKTREVMNFLENGIKNLQPTKVRKHNVEYVISFKLYPTMVDGKVCQALSETKSSSTCYICKANPLEMNNIPRCLEMRSKLATSDNYQFGLSTLHAWIRFMECLLHVAYRLEIKKWAAKGADKELMKEKKLQIQRDFKKKMGLIVDVPKHGSGTSNDGNTARRFFRDPRLTSEITGLDYDVIKRFGIILQTMACGEKIDAEKFDEYALQTAELYVKHYYWYYMPSSVHKILIHGADVIKSAHLPIGQLSEEAQEARNKDFKRFREYNTRKCSRLATNIDLAHKLLISSDPVIGSLRHAALWKSKDNTVDEEARSLLSN